MRIVRTVLALQDLLQPFPVLFFVADTVFQLLAGLPAVGDGLQGVFQQRSVIRVHTLQPVAQIQLHVAGWQAQQGGQGCG